MYPEDSYNRRTPIQRALDPGASIRPLTAPSLKVAAAPAAAPPPAATAPPQEQDQLVANAGSDLGAVPAGAVGAAPGEGGGLPNSDQLAMWGYNPIGFNDLELKARDFINNLYNTGGALETMVPAQDFYNKVISGEFGPEGQTYLQQVLDPMRASMMSDYEDMSKGLAGRFSNFGGYYGGKSGVAQAKLSDLTQRSMAEKEAGLRYQRFADDIGGRMGAAEGLRGLAGNQSAASGDMLNFLLSGGNMITQRESMNTAEYQNALQRAYNDWLRARQESLQPFNWGQALLGVNAVQPIVTQTQSPWGALLGGLGTLAGAGGMKLAGM
jgi:hypothetical protein